MLENRFPLPVDHPRDHLVTVDAVDGQAALIVDEAVLSTDPVVLTEACRWSTGRRAEPLELAEVAGTDLSVFLTEALSLGARVLATASSAAETQEVQRAVKDAATHLDDALTRVTHTTEAAVKRASDTMLTEVHRLIGGENPQLAEQLRPILNRVGTNLEAQLLETLAKANAQAHEKTSQEAARRHTELADLIHGVHRELVAREAATDSARAVRSATTLKGFDFETQLHAVLTGLAQQMGDHYTETGNLAGALPRNKKGDGVWSTHGTGGECRIVVEAHDGSTKDWGTYLVEAERNRRANASIGVARRLSDNADCAIRVLGPRRIVLAFDPETATEADVEFLRAAVLLMKTAALSDATTVTDADLPRARETVQEALAALEGLNDTQKSVAAIVNHADKITTSIARTVTSVQRQLSRTLDALG